ncbi:MAG: 16S rRNA (guanine(966)-N(2))-methyltransferase RsmD [Firmicutes bacterium]|nr:16S rRNA (guanine(966)-N(2))-methyltransferase RsmD [Bacillota bacterium]
MRIISGEYRGRKLETPINNDVRPTTDKVKEAMFSILMPYTEDAICLDLFAGTGGLGLEALSRGASYCVFCDKDRASISLIKENIRRCGAEAKSKVIQGDYMKALERATGKFDIIIIDPPYNSGIYEKCLSSIEKLDLLSDEGIIIVEHEKNGELSDYFGKYTKIKDRSYGKTILTLYGVDALEEEE